MEPRAKEWMLATARGDYHAIARLLREEPRLARRRVSSKTQLLSFSLFFFLSYLLVRRFWLFRCILSDVIFCYVFISFPSRFFFFRVFSLRTNRFVFLFSRRRKKKTKTKKWRTFVCWRLSTSVSSSPSISSDETTTPIHLPIFLSLFLSPGRDVDDDERRIENVCVDTCHLSTCFPLSRLPAYVCVMRSYLVYIAPLSQMCDDDDDEWCRRRQAQNTVDRFRCSRLKTSPWPGKALLTSLFIFVCVCVKG